MSTECDRVLNRLIYAIQKSRSIIRETVELHNSGKIVLVEDVRHHDEWAFSKDAVQWLETLAAWKNPTPVDVMNIMSYMGLRRKSKNDPAKPGDSMGLNLLRTRWDYNMSQNPVLALTRLEGM